MKYLGSSPFSTHAPPGQEYRDNHDRIFGKKSAPKTGVDMAAQARAYEEAPSPTYTEMVREFHTVFSQPIVDKPTIPSKDRVQLRLRLIKEEFFELLAASEIWPEGAGVTASGLIDDAIADDFSGCVDIVETADALADLVYVIEGMALELGIDLPAVVKEVHRSNLSKTGRNGKAIYNEYGKVVKGPNYSPPNVLGVLHVVR